MACMPVELSLTGPYWPAIAALPIVLRDYHIHLPMSPICPEEALLNHLRDTCHNAGHDLHSIHM